MKLRGGGGYSRVHKTDKRQNPRTAAARASDPRKNFLLEKRLEKTRKEQRRLWGGGGGESNP